MVNSYHIPTNSENSIMLTVTCIISLPHRHPTWLWSFTQEEIKLWWRPGNVAMHHSILSISCWESLETSLADECLNFCNHSGKVTIITAWCVKWGLAITSVHLSVSLCIQKYSKTLLEGWLYRLSQPRVKWMFMYLTNMSRLLSLFHLFLIGGLFAPSLLKLYVIVT